jgi:hypothetical protein
MPWVSVTACLLLPVTSAHVSPHEHDGQPPGSVHLVLPCNSASWEIALFVGLAGLMPANLMPMERPDICGFLTDFKRKLAAPSYPGQLPVIYGGQMTLPDWPAWPV